MILSEAYCELPDDLDDDDLDAAIDEAFDAAVVIAADKHIMLDVFLHHLEKIYPVWNRDAGAWNQLLSISEIDDEIIMKIHQECCRIYDSLHPN
jgi:hypothetical protein